MTNLQLFKKNKELKIELKLKNEIINILTSNLKKIKSDVNIALKELEEVKITNKLYKEKLAINIKQIEKLLPTLKQVQEDITKYTNKLK